MNACHHPCPSVAYSLAKKTDGEQENVHLSLASSSVWMGPHSVWLEKSRATRLALWQWGGLAKTFWGGGVSGEV